MGLWGPIVKQCEQEQAPLSSRAGASAMRHTQSNKTQGHQEEKATYVKQRKPSGTSKPCLIPLRTTQVVKEIIIEVLSSLRESSANESHDNIATSKETAKPGKYGLVDNFVVIMQGK